MQFLRGDGYGWKMYSESEVFGIWKTPKMICLPSLLCDDNLLTVTF